MFNPKWLTNQYIFSISEDQISNVKKVINYKDYNASEYECTTDQPFEFLQTWQN